MLEGLTNLDNVGLIFRNAMALGARDRASRAQLATAGAAYTGFNGDEKIHPEAVDANWRYIALLVAVEEYGKPYTDLLWRHFLAADNALLRQNLLGAMAESTDPGVAATVRELILSPELRDNEIFSIFRGQMAKEETRQDIWDWSKSNMTAILERIPTWSKGQIPAQFQNFCSIEHADDIDQFFSPMIDTLESGPRYLANALETIRLCAAFVELHGNHDNS